MLKIRAEQMDAFSAYMRKQFEDRMVEHLRSRFPRAVRHMQEEELRELVRKGVKRAEGYGVTQEFDVRRYLECTVEHGADFDVNPATAWAGKILSAEGLSGSAKMDRIDEYETFALRGP